MTELMTTQATPSIFHPILPGMEIPKRPDKGDDYVAKRVLELIRPSVEQWLRNGGTSWTDSVEEQLREVMFSFDDGFNRAFILKDRYYWEGNNELVDLMDQMDSFEYQAIKELTRQWVKAYNVVVNLVIGQPVRITKQYWRQEAEGIVLRIDADIAEVSVHTPSQRPTEAWVLKIDDVEAILG